MSHRRTSPSPSRASGKAGTQTPGDWMTAKESSVKPGSATIEFDIPDPDQIYEDMKSAPDTYAESMRAIESGKIKEVIERNTVKFGLTRASLGNRSLPNGPVISIIQGCRSTRCPTSAWASAAPQSCTRPI